jgi:hypothetical protein
MSAKRSVKRDTNSPLNAIFVALRACLYARSALCVVDMTRSSGRMNRELNPRIKLVQK